MNNIKEKVNIILEGFEKLYPDAKCSLNYKNSLELLIATQLSAQCTDARVNIVTEKLFEKYKTVEDFAKANLKELEEDIRSTGFYHNKAKNIKSCCKTLIEKFDGNIPNNMEDMLTLAGVGRKTANLVLGVTFDIPGIVVDTHAKRVSKRLGFTKFDDPTKVEKDLMKIIPKEKWTKFCHQLVYHGRAVCKARKPLCEECLVKNECDFYTSL